MHFLEGDSRYTGYMVNDVCSQNEIYDIGTEILFLQLSDRNSTQEAPKSMKEVIASLITQLPRSVPRVQATKTIN